MCKYESHELNLLFFQIIVTSNRMEGYVRVTSRSKARERLCVAGGTQTVRCSHMLDTLSGLNESVHCFDWC
jgi:hypothetical protein